MKDISRREAITKIATGGAGLGLLAASSELVTASQGSVADTTTARAFRGVHQPRPLPFDPAGQLDHNFRIDRTMFHAFDLPLQNVSRTNLHGFPPKYARSNMMTILYSAPTPCSSHQIRIKPYSIVRMKNGQIGEIVESNKSKLNASAKAILMTCEE